MNVIVVGGGKVGYYLSATLLEHGHNPIIIEKDKERAHYIANMLNLKVICADGSLVEALENAGAKTASALVSVTGADEDNLIICQLAKRKFNVARTVARVNNPKNAEVIKQLGVDITVSSSDSLARIIEREVDTASIRQLMQLNRGKSTLLELTLPKDFKQSGKNLQNITLPHDSIIMTITRGGEMIIPRGSTELLCGDRLLVVCKDAVVHELCKALDIK